MKESKCAKDILKCANEKHQNYLNKLSMERAQFVWLAMRKAFLTSEQPERYHLWSCQKVCDAVHYLLDNIYSEQQLKDIKKSFDYIKI